MQKSSGTAVLATWPLLTGMGVLMLGAGLQGTLIGLRATLEGFAPFVTGVVMSCYYLGYIAGSIGAPQLMQRVGHIRVFAALTAVASAAILLQAALVSPPVWAVLRMISGFCFAGIYVIAESWLNDRASNVNRGTLLASYMLVLYLGLGSGQFLLTAADPKGPLLFLLVSVLISLAVVPIALVVQRAPEFDIPRKIRFIDLYHASHMGVVGVIAAGFVTSSVSAMGPVYAQLIGLNSRELATFMGVSIFAAAATQLPIGRLSDRVDRRNVLITVCVLASCIAVSAAAYDAMSKAMLFVFSAAFGGIALTLYSLSLSHINDHLAADQIVSASGSVILLNGLGSIVGPMSIALLMNRFGPPAYFFALAAAVGSLAAYGLWRKSQRPPVPLGLKVPFANAQPQTLTGRMLAEIAHDAVMARDDVR
jgi:MFS family permease